MRAASNNRGGDLHQMCATSRACRCVRRTASAWPRALCSSLRVLAGRPSRPRALCGAIRAAHVSQQQPATLNLSCEPSHCDLARNWSSQFASSPSNHHQHHHQLLVGSHGHSSSAHIISPSSGRAKDGIMRVANNAARLGPASARTGQPRSCQLIARPARRRNLLTI